MLKKVNGDDMDYIDELSAVHEGRGFTGYSVEPDDGYTDLQLFVNGFALGPRYTVSDSGNLTRFSHTSIEQTILGGAYVWNEEGSLISETIVDDAYNILFIRKWNDNGSLASLLDDSRNTLSIDDYFNRNPRDSWIHTPKIYLPQEVASNQFTTSVAREHLQTHGEEGRLLLNEKFFTGNVLYLSDDGMRESRAIVEGFEEGGVFRWSPDGLLIAQGVCRHPYGLVGPWHEWDERGLLLREIIYDALGNKIIHRELDEAQNIVSQEYFGPVTLMTDPETGEQHPAPWL